LSDSWKLPVLDAPSPKKQLLGQPRACGHRDVASHDAGGPQISLLHIGDVHGAATSQAVTGGATAEFGHHLVVVLLPRLLRLGQGGAPGVAVAVPAMSAGDEIVVPQSGNSSHRHCLLASVEVRRALDDVAPQQVVDPVLEHSNLPHLPQEIEGLLFIEAEFF
jgi:hypothetical protein